MLFSATPTQKTEALARVSLKKRPMYVGVDDAKKEATVEGLEQVRLCIAICPRCFDCFPVPEMFGFFYILFWAGEGGEMDGGIAFLFFYVCVFRSQAVSVTSLYKGKCAHCCYN